MVNLDTGTVFAFISEGSPVRYQLRQYVRGQSSTFSGCKVQCVYPYALPFNRKLTMQITIAPYLLSTYKLIQCAFPNGIEIQYYLPLLALLYDEMSDRNLAGIVAHYTTKHYGVVLNDVYRVRTTDVPKAEAINKVKQRLLVCGYEEWLKEAE